jgi:hypothetical protein
MAAEAVERDDKWLIKRIQSHLRNGINSEEGEVTDTRQDLFDAYMGGELGNERDGYSSIVTREVLQAVEWALPALMRVFLGGVKAVSFKASGPDDVEQAKLETDAVNYWFMDGNPNQSGFIILYTFLKDLLMNPNAYMSVEPVEEQDRDVQRYEGLNEAQIEALEEQGAEVSVQKRSKQAVEGMGEVEVYDVLAVTTKEKKRIEVTTLPPDMVIIDHDHHELNCDTARFVCLRSRKTISDVRKLGYDVYYEDIGPSETDDTWNDEETNRLFYIDEQPNDSDDADDLDADKVTWLNDCYMRVDFDGDGISELRRVVMVGCEIVENEEIEAQPVVAGSALPVPHRHVGMGYAELCLDLQQLMTTLTRQLLDNIYAQNIQRTYINESAMLSDGTTMEQLLDGTNQYILVRGVPAQAVMPETITPIVNEIVAAIDAMKETPQLRTGVAPQLSLDPSVLEKSTMGAFVGALDQASQRLELLARLVAETALKPMFLKIHHQMRTHFDEPQPLEINGQWVNVDPRTWKKRASMTVNVGLGFNNKQMMLTLLQSLLAVQKEALPSGLADVKTIYNTLELLVEQANLGHARTYFVDPKQPGWKEPQPKPDPAMILAEAQAAALKAESARKDAETKANIEKMKEEAEAKAADMLNEFMGLKGKDALTIAQIAKIHAEITNLNRDDGSQAEPAEDSSADEFARAGGLVGDTAGEREAERGAKGGQGKPTAPEDDKASGDRHAELLEAVRAPKTVKRDPKTNAVIGVESAPVKAKPRDPAEARHQEVLGAITEPKAVKRDPKTNKVIGTEGAGNGA